MIICAALRLTNSKEDIVIPCHRHYNGYQILHDLCIDYHKYDIIEGFITHDNTFLNRKDAFIHWNMCGQSSAEMRQMKCQREEDELFSEDLY